MLIRICFLQNDPTSNFLSVSNVVTHVGVMGFQRVALVMNKKKIFLGGHPEGWKVSLNSRWSGSMTEHWAIWRKQQLKKLIYERKNVERHEVKSYHNYSLFSYLLSIGGPLVSRVAVTALNSAWMNPIMFPFGFVSVSNPTQRAAPRKRLTRWRHISRQSVSSNFHAEGVILERQRGWKIPTKSLKSG
jgi:hypothetical protein